MQVLIVYESIYGTNRLIAESVAEGIGSSAATTIIEAKSAPSLIGADVSLLIVGGPNHKTGLPSPETRKELNPPTDLTGNQSNSGLREWLERLQFVQGKQPVAVWDTRMAHPRILDYIDRSRRVIAKHLTRRKASLIAKPQKFYSADGKGALLPGEIDRAKAWGAELARLGQTRLLRDSC